MRRTYPTECATRRCCLRMEVEDLDLFAAAAVG